MADSLLDNYNPLYDIHLRQYFALPHMQKHLQKMGLLESTLNLNDDQVYARHHAMMDMMLKNREAQLVKMAELRKKLDAAEKVECCRRIRTGHSPESYRQGKPSRSLSRNRAGQKNGGGSGGRQRRYSNSFEDRDFVQRIEERNADPVEQNTKDPYKRLSANAKRFNYLHKLDDNTLVAYKDNLKKQLQRLERFREISFGPHSVARQAPPPQASWFFRRRSVLNMRGRKATTGNKLNASHDSRTSCPPTTRKRKDSNTRLPPIHPPKNRVPTKPPAPVSLQQITTKLPPAAKKPAPTRGRPSNKRQTTTTTTTITAVSKSPPIADTTLPQLPSVTGHGIFTGAAAAATAAAIGTAALNMDALIGKDEPEEPVLETQKTFDRDTPADQEEVQAEILDALADQSEKVAEQDEQEFIPRQVVLDNTPINHGDYEDSDSEPEYAEEDKETPTEEETFVRQDVGQQGLSPVEPLEVHAHAEPVKTPEDSPREVIKEHEPIPVAEETPVASARTPPTLIFTEQSTEDNGDQASESGRSEHSAQQSPIVDVHSTHVVEHFETHDEIPQSPVLSVHGGAEHEEAPQSPVLSVHSSHHSEHHEVLEHADRQSPVLSVHSSHHSEHNDSQAVSENAAPQSPVLSVHSSHQSEIHEEQRHSPISSEHAEPEPASQSPVLSIHSSHHSEAAVPQSLASSVHSSMQQSLHETAYQPEAQSPVLSHHSEHFTDHQDAAAPVPQSPVGSVHHSENQDHDQIAARSPVSLENFSQHPEASIPVSHSPIGSVHHAEHDEQDHVVPQSPVLSVNSSHHSEHPAPLSPAASEHQFEHLAHQMSPPQSPIPSEKDAVELSPSIYSSQASEQLDSEQNRQEDEFEHSRSVRSTTMESSSTMMQESFVAEQSPAPVQAAPRSPVTSEKDIAFERAPSVHSQGSEGFEHVDASIDHHAENVAPQSPVASDKDGVFERASSVHSSHASEHLDVPSSPIASPTARDTDEKEAENPLLAVHTSSYHEPAPHSPLDSEHAQSPVNDQHSPVAAQQQEVHSSMHQSQYQENDEQPIPQSPALSHHSEHMSEHHNAAVPVPQSPDGSVRHSEHQEDHATQSPVLTEHFHQQENHHIDLSDVPKSPALSMSDSYAPDHLEHEAAPKSPDLPSEKDEFVPRSPSVHTSDAEEEHIVVQHHAGLTEEAPSKSPTEMDLYNPSRENQESPVMAESLTPAAIPIADRIDLEAYHNSPTKESTSPVAVNPTEVHISAEQVAEQLESPKQRSNFEEMINKSAEEEASQLVQEAMSEAPAIIDMVNAYEEKEKFPEAYELKNDQSEASGADVMMTSIYQPTAEDQPVHNGDGEHDNISTDSLVIHDNQPDPMTQSIYQPHEHTEESEWDEGNKHVHEVISSHEHTDESGKHFTETVTTTTTVVKSGDDLENNNDEVDQESGSDEEDDKEKIIEEEEEHGSNGNLVRETITTTNRTITSGGLPEGGILVDDGDEKNISSL